MKCVKYF